MDQATDAMFRQDSIGFTASSTTAIDGEITTIEQKGAWTNKPRAWKTTSKIDRPESPSITLLDGDATTELVYVQATPRLVYVRFTPKGGEPSSWVPPPSYGVSIGVSQQDLTFPAALRLLSRVDASSATASGDAVVISGLVPTTWALDELSLTSRISDLGFTGRLTESTTRVLVTIGADGLPTSLEFSGAGIGVAGLELPDYLLDEFARARFFAEYGEADLKGPIKKPPTTVYGG